MNRLIHFGLLLFLVITMSAATDLTIVPKPARVEPRNGTFILTAMTPFIVAGGSTSAMKDAQFVSGQIERLTGILVTPRMSAMEEKNAVTIRVAPKESSLGAEGYRLEVSPTAVRLTGGGDAGVLYGLETLIQLLPVAPKRPASRMEIPAVFIEDRPRFSWRGMHLDVSRHFFPKSFIKTWLEMLAFHKMNVFHWHLTDDQGWRIEIKKHPNLTRVGAWRVDRENLDWNARPPQQAGETPTYGGFYTQEDIREIVAYAAERHITILPEIEMPAHSVAALAAYPELSCTQKEFTVLPGSYWPNADIFCAGNDSTFFFLEDVLDEVISLFPGTFIHVGGDEADRTEWKRCPKCQARMKAEGLRDEGELQSYFIKRVERYIVAHGKRLIGWDEILEGGLPPEATVMSWRGIDGGIAAARQRHDVVMSPTDNCYFDYYQGNPAYEPQAIGGFLPLKRVYGYEPVPDSLTPEEARHVLGAQANVWSEFIPTGAHAQYMSLPRMAAIAEVVWTPKESRSWDDFSLRVPFMMKRYEGLGYAYSRSGYLVNMTVRIDSASRRGTCTLSAEIPSASIRYTLSGKDPDARSAVYAAPIAVDSNVTIRAASFSDTGRVSPVTEQQIVLHRACFKPVRLAYPAEKYGTGPDALTNGIRGTRSYSDGNWLGFHGVDVDATVDLGSMQSIRRCETNFLQNIVSWIFLPSRVEYSVSDDGVTFRTIGTIMNDHPGSDGPMGIHPYALDGTDIRARYVRVMAKTIGLCPAWHPGKGERSWLFIDEIAVE